MDRTPAPSRRLIIAVLAALLAAGAPSPAAETVLIDFATPMKHHRPLDASLGTTWTEKDFPDAAWADGSYAVGYDAGGMVRTLVPNTTQAVYTRARFTIDDLSAVESVWLGVDYDDGYVAWINGFEVARSTSMPPGAPAFDTEASNHESTNGATPTFDPVRDITAAARARLETGENVLAIGVWNTELPSSDLALAPYLSINRPVAPPVEVHWTVAGSPYRLSADLDFPPNTTLRIDPGVTVLAAAGVELRIEGRILAEGTAEAPITFDRDGTSGSWDGIHIDHGGDGVPRSSAIRHARLLRGSTLIDVEATGDSEVLIEDCVLDSWSSLAFHWDDGANGLRIRRCRVGMETPPAEQSHEAVNGYRSSAVLEDSEFGPRRGYNDTIDLADTKWGGPVPTVRGNVIHPGEDDGIDFDDCDGWIIGNLVYGRRPPAGGETEDDCPQFPIAGSGSNGGGITGNEGSRPVVMHNVVYDCFHGIGYKNAADPVLIGNTVAGCTWGIVLFETSDISAPEVAHATLVNNLIWDCDVPIRTSWCDTAPFSTVEAWSNLVPGGWPGEGNISPAESPFALETFPAAPVLADFRLKPCAAALDAAYAGPVERPYVTVDVPDRDAQGSPRLDLDSMTDTGAGTPRWYDLGALELQEPDSCDPLPPRFIRGDGNGDGSVDISDAITVLFVLYAGLPRDCADALDADDDGVLASTDAIRILEGLFTTAPDLPPPFPGAGTDPTADDLGCER